MKAGVSCLINSNNFFTIKLQKFFKKCLQESKKHSIFALALRHESIYDGAIAQLVEQRTENPCVPGSIPGGTTAKKSKTT